MKNLFIACALLFTTLTFAQKTFFETVKEKGENPVYIEYPGIYINNEGEQSVHLSQERVGQYNEPTEVIVKLLNHNGIDSGFTMLKNSETGDKKSYYKADFTKGRQTFTGFPNTYIVYENVFNQGYIAIDNFIFYIDHFNSRTEFGDIRRVYVLKGTTPNGESSGKKKKKKKGFGKFLGKVKNVALNTNSGPNPKNTPEYKAISQVDARQMVTDYLKSMRAKQVAYNMTSKDNADLASLTAEADAYRKYIKNKNDAYWKSPAGQKTLRGWKLADEHQAVCRKTAESCGSPFH